MGERQGKNSFFALLNRMKYINRWGLMRCVRQENLAEHTLDTVYIAHALALINNLRCADRADFLPADADRCALIAAYHDCSEILTGDMPTPIKYKNEALRAAYKEVEAGAVERLLDTLPDDLRLEYAALARGGEGIERRIVKAADKISALIKCREEFSTGNKEFLNAEYAQSAAIKEMNLAAADIFIEEYLQEYFRTIDLL